MIQSQFIESLIEQNRPLNGKELPVNFKQRIGATHVAGKYYLTTDPFIIEGSKKLYDLGFGVLKLWFRKTPEGIEGSADHNISCGYPYNSQWSVSSDISLKDLANHPYYHACFDLPFTTIILSIHGAGINITNESAALEEKEMYDLTHFLLQKYKDRDVTFILQNWEGDWMLRGGIYDHASWSITPGQSIDVIDGKRITVPIPDDVTQRVEKMIQWFTCRQNAVNNARNDVKESKCKVFHAIEVNKVLDCMNRIPGLVTHVLPNVETDMVSYSCYDALTSDGIDLYKGIKYIKEHINPSQYMNGERIVYIGEIGVPEQRYETLNDKNQVVNTWDIYTAVCLALDIPYMIIWELYCNEPKDNKFRTFNKLQKRDDLMGFWLIRPDGTKSFAGEYFEYLLQNKKDTVLDFD